jgi:hypothetical protein
MSNPPRPSLIRNLLNGRPHESESDAAADQALDDALMKLSRACDDNVLATANVRRRQSSGSLKLISLPEAVGDGAE